MTPCDHGRGLAIITDGPVADQHSRCTRCGVEWPGIVRWTPDGVASLTEPPTVRRSAPDLLAAYAAELGTSIDQQLAGVGVAAVFARRDTRRVVIELDLTAAAQLAVALRCERTCT